MKIGSNGGARRRSRAMALVSVLLVTVVLLGLAGAFFAAHKSDLALMTSSTYREQSRNACLSVADFVQYKLQNDRKFGTVAFSSDGRVPASEKFPASSPSPILEVDYIGNGSDVRSNVIRGKMPASNVTFEVILINNLDSRSWFRYAASKETPPRTARAWVTARRGNITQNIDFIVKRSPFTNASITSGNNIDVQLTDSDGQWGLGSRQPSGNAVRAGGQITGPEVWSKTGRSVEFLAPPGMSELEPPYGVIQADVLNMKVDGVPTNLRAGDTKLLESEDNIDGVLSPGTGKLEVPDLKGDDLQGAGIKVRPPRTDIVFQTKPGFDGRPIHYLIGDGREMASYDPQNYDDYGNNGRFFSWQDDNFGQAVRFDLESRVMAVADNVSLKTNETFKLRALTADGDPDMARQPTLYLGAGMADTGASLDAKNIDIQGSVGGKGALKSSVGDLTIAAKSTLSTTPDFGIALHSNEDVILTKPGNNANDGLAVDWDAFAQGLRNGGSNTALDTWSTLDENSKNTAASSFQERSLASAANPQSFDELWDGLTADFPADDAALQARKDWLRQPVAAVEQDDPAWSPDPTLPLEGQTPPKIVVTPAVPAGDGISLGKYVRLREYLRSVKSGVPDPTWLNTTDPDISAQRNSDVANLVKNQLSTYQLAAGQTSEEVRGQVTLKWNKLADYFASGKANPYTASYAPDMLFRGLIYAKGDFRFDTEKQGIYIEGALVAKGNISITDATGAQFVYNSELLENLFATDEEDTSVPLERSYWAYY